MSITERPKCYYDYDRESWFTSEGGKLDLAIPPTIGPSDTFTFPIHLSHKRLIVLYQPSVKHPIFIDPNDTSFSPVSTDKDLWPNGKAGKSTLVYLSKDFVRPHRFVFSLPLRGKDADEEVIAEVDRYLTQVGMDTHIREVGEHNVKITLKQIDIWLEHTHHTAFFHHMTSVNCNKKTKLQQMFEITLHCNT